MRFYLFLIATLISFSLFGQAPPMSIGGNQGISVKRLNVQDWMSVPILSDTPVAPLTTAGWPGRAYLVFVAKTNELCLGCPPADTSLWEYTGARWKRVGTDYLTKLAYGADVELDGGISRRYIVSPYGAFINGDWVRKVTDTNVDVDPKTPDSTSRIDVIVIRRTGPGQSTVLAKKGQARVNPFKPSITNEEIELSTVYFPPFDTTARFLPTSSAVTYVYRIPGKDSIFFSIDSITLAIKDSVGVTKNDTATMLRPYGTSAANGITKDSTVFRLGGILNQNTEIQLGGRRFMFLRASGDTSIMITADGNLLHGTTDTTQGENFWINRSRIRLGNLQITSGVSAQYTTTGIRIDGTDRPFIFQGSGILTAPDMFRFTNRAGDTATAVITNNNMGVVRVYGGFRAPVNLPNLSGNVLWLTPRYDFTDTAYLSSTTVRGVYYNPTIAALGNVMHIAYENTTGSNLLNSTSGNTRIGYSTVDTTFKFDVNGKVRITDTLTLSITPSTADTTSNDILVINSSNGQVRRYTGAWPEIPLNGSATLDFPNTSAASSSDLTITVTGASEGDIVSLGVPNGSVSGNSCYTAWVSATDTVTVRFNNYSGGGIDPSSGTFKIKVFK